MADLVCPICFDLGFTKTSFRGELANDGLGGTSYESLVKQAEGSKSAEPQEQSEAAKLAEKSEVEERLVVGDNAGKSTDGQSEESTGDDEVVASMLKLLAQGRGTGNPLVVSGPMQHKDDGHIESLYTLPINLDTVEPDVKGLLFGDRTPASRVDALAAFPTVQLIKNMMIAFKVFGNLS